MSMNWPFGILLALLAAIGGLGLALISQYGFGHEPCVLCLWQRLPYVLIILIAVLGLCLRPLRPWRGALLLLIAFCWAVGAGIAFYHNGVEQHWWAGTSGCAIQATASQDPAALRLSLLAQPVARCDQISWSFLGLSMAVWNLIFSLLMAVAMGFFALFGRANPYEQISSKAENKHTTIT
jgi:disulfide bond formation protein DsbB